METPTLSPAEVEELRGRIKERLSEQKNVDALCELILAYYVDTREIATLAETLSEGMRFDGLANEVYACFQHMSRGLAAEKADPIKEFEKANNSHLKRLRLDGHKIVINRALRDAKPILDSLDLISSNSEIVHLLPEGQKTLSKVRELRKQLRSKYLEAKRKEGRGDENTLECFQEALSLSIKLLSEIEHFSTTNEVLFAITREAERRVESRDSIETAKESNEIAKKSAEEAVKANTIASGASKTSKWSVGIAAVSALIALASLVWAIYVTQQASTENADKSPQQVSLEATPQEVEIPAQQNNGEPIPATNP